MIRDAEKILQLENENQLLRKDLADLRTAHFAQNERLTSRAAALEDALLAVVRDVLPPHATPAAMRRWGDPWPQVSNALWPDT